MIYNGNPLLNWMIWGENPYFWKPPYSSWGIDSCSAVFLEGDLRWASDHVEHFASGPGSTGLKQLEEVGSVGPGWNSLAFWDFEPAKSRILKPGTQCIVVLVYIWVV